MIFEEAAQIFCKWVTQSIGHVAWYKIERASTTWMDLDFCIFFCSYHRILNVWNILAYYLNICVLQLKKWKKKKKIFLISMLWRQYPPMELRLVIKIHCYYQAKFQWLILTSKHWSERHVFLWNIRITIQKWSAGNAAKRYIPCSFVRSTKHRYYRIWAVFLGVPRTLAAECHTAQCMHWIECGVHCGKQDFRPKNNSS